MNSKTDSSAKGESAAGRKVDTLKTMCNGYQEDERKYKGTQRTHGVYPLLAADA